MKLITLFVFLCMFGFGSAEQQTRELYGRQTRVMNRSLPANCTQKVGNILCTIQPAIGEYPVGPYYVWINGSYVKGPDFFESLDAYVTGGEDARVKGISSAIEFKERYVALPNQHKEFLDAGQALEDIARKNIAEHEQGIIKWREVLERKNYLVHGHGGYSQPSATTLSVSATNLRGSAPSAVSSETETTSENGIGHVVVLYVLLACFVFDKMYSNRRALMKCIGRIRCRC
jgi:hypothetical protein